MKARLATASAVILLLSSPVMAQGDMGAHFIENWDLDGNGSVSLAEAQEKRGDIFYMFDQDEDGVLNSEEYDLFDETRAADMEQHQEDQQAGMSGMDGMSGTSGRGMGRGQGQGHGMGMRGNPMVPKCLQWSMKPNQGWTCTNVIVPGQQQMGMGRMRGMGGMHGMSGMYGMGGMSGMGENGYGMARGANDTNGDGKITQEEFTGGTEAWFTRRDKNGDGVITVEDFGRGR